MSIILFDCHSHTKFSADSDMKIEDALKIAQAMGLGLITTEHIDFDFPGDDLYEFDAADYFALYRKYRETNHFLLGVEIGMQAQTALQSGEFIKKSPFDMVIVSQHIIEGYDIYFPEYYQGKCKNEAYGIYLQTIADMLTAHPFGDVLGHIDYICRKAPYEDKQLRYDEFPSHIDKIWQTALANDIIPEVNTRRFADKEAVSSLTSIYTRYHNMGGRYATIGSDAHTADAVGYKLEEASCFLKNCGLIPVYFKNRQPVSML